ncbi:hypothetical protein ACLOJK_031431 [Asimina triloba]
MKFFYLCLVEGLYNSAWLMPAPLPETLVTVEPLKGKEIPRVYSMTMEDAVEEKIRARGHQKVSSKRLLSHTKATDKPVKKKGRQLIKESKGNYENQLEACLAKDLQLKEVKVLSLADAKGKGEIITVETDEGDIIDVFEALSLWL